jgi:hypothetical protein
MEYLRAEWGEFCELNSSASDYGSLAGVCALNFSLRICCNQEVSSPAELLSVFKGRLFA